MTANTASGRPAGPDGAVLEQSPVHDHGMGVGRRAARHRSRSRWSRDGVPVRALDPGGGKGRSQPVGVEPIGAGHEGHDGLTIGQKTSDFTICPTWHPTARAASSAVRVPVGKRSTLISSRPPSRRRRIARPRLPSIDPTRSARLPGTGTRQGSASALSAVQPADPRT